MSRPLFPPAEILTSPFFTRKIVLLVPSLFFLPVPSFPPFIQDIPQGKTFFDLIFYFVEKANLLSFHTLKRRNRLLPTFPKVPFPPLPLLHIFSTDALKSPSQRVLMAIIFSPGVKPTFSIRRNPPVSLFHGPVRTTPKMTHSE